MTSANGTPEPVSFPTQDGWTIHADLYGAGDRGVVLVHGGRFAKESWREQAGGLAKAGFRVLAIDLRGYGHSTEGPETTRGDMGSLLDVLAAIRYLRGEGIKTVSLVGGSMGGDAAGGASAMAESGDIDALVVLASAGAEAPQNMKGRKLFVLCRDDLQGGGEEPQSAPRCFTTWCRQQPGVIDKGRTNSPRRCPGVGIFSSGLVAS